MNPLASFSLRQIHGFGLIELMIALALGTLVIASSFTAYGHANASYRAAQIEARLHERAQYVFGTLEPDIQMAGYFGVGPAPLRLSPLGLPPSLTRCGVSLVAKLDNPMEIDDNRYSLPCPAQGRGAVANSDVVIVRRASTTLTVPTAGRLQLLGSLINPRARAVLWTGQLPQGIALAPPSTELRDLVVHIYYVARSADGDDATSALRVKSLSSVAGVPTFIDTEVMQGVNNLQIEVQIQSDGTKTARLQLGLQSDTSDQRINEPLRRITTSRLFQIRNAT
jgi:prepilin-type N-terminal cleavage/methylation domain-containing protein